MILFRVLRNRLVGLDFQLSIIFVLLILSSEFLAAQATVSAGPLLLYQVRTIYLAPSSDEVVLHLRAGLEKWSAVALTSKPEEADAVLSCTTETTVVPAKVAIRHITAEVTLEDRLSHRPIWKTSKSASFEASRLADEIVQQLKMDWRKSSIDY